MQTNSFFFSLFSVSTTTCRDMFTIQELGFCFPKKTSTDTIMEPKKKKKIINFLSFTFFFSSLSCFFLLLKLVHLDWYYIVTLLNASFWRYPPLLLCSCWLGGIPPSPEWIVLSPHFEWTNTFPIPVLS